MSAVYNRRVKLTLFSLSVVRHRAMATVNVRKHFGLSKNAAEGAGDCSRNWTARVRVKPKKKSLPKRSVNMAQRKS
jgi:hypothetical protein